MSTVEYSQIGFNTDSFKHDHNSYVHLFQGSDLSEAQEGDPKYMAPELLDGKFGKPADICR